MAAPGWLPLLWLRVSDDALAGRRCGELVDWALHPIALTNAVCRGHLVVIGRLRLQILHAHPENRLWMAPVEPDLGFRRLAELLGIRTVGHDGEMLVRASRVGGGPPDNGNVVVCNFELRPFGDLDVLSPLLRRKDLSDGWVGGKQAADRSGDRQFQEQSIHRTDPQLLFPGKDGARGHGARAPMHPASRSMGSAGWAETAVRHRRSRARRG